jgi:hypothetical protein
VLTLRTQANMDATQAAATTGMAASSDVNSEDLFQGSNHVLDVEHLPTAEDIWRCGRT